MASSIAGANVTSPRSIFFCTNSGEIHKISDSILTGQAEVLNSTPSKAHGGKDLLVRGKPRRVSQNWPRIAAPPVVGNNMCIDIAVRVRANYSTTIYLACAEVTSGKSSPAGSSSPFGPGPSATRIYVGYGVQRHRL
jgi:hypothetical protein